VAIDTISSGTILTKPGGVTTTVSGVDMFEVTSAGAVLADGNMYADTFVADILSVASGEHTIDDEPETIFCDCTSGEVTLTLPSAAPSTQAGRRYVFKKTAGGNNIVVNAASGETIEGAASLTMSTSGESAQIESDGTSWWKI